MLKHISLNTINTLKIKTSENVNHECKDFKLSASDQSVIDMMKHYLHTSRKTECSDNKLSITFK
jgi:hypothetical protein